jgi:hypothetical protein
LVVVEAGLDIRSAPIFYCFECRLEKFLLLAVTSSKLVLGHLFCKRT